MRILSALLNSYIQYLKLITHPGGNWKDRIEYGLILIVMTFIILIIPVSILLIVL